MSLITAIEMARPVRLYAGCFTGETELDADRLLTLGDVLANDDGEIAVAVREGLDGSRVEVIVEGGGISDEYLRIVLDPQRAA